MATTVTGMWQAATGAMRSRVNSPSFVSVTTEEAMGKRK
jgi:hypothetical protein